MAIIVIVGEQGAGKGSVLKSRFLVIPKEKLCYALIRADLGENLTYIRNRDEYINKACTMKDTMFVIDEAQTFFSKKEPDSANNPMDRKMMEWFVNQRKCNNMILIVYHSLRDVPLWILTHTNYFLRFNTKENLNIQKTRFSSHPNIVTSIENYPVIEKLEYDEIKLR